MGKIVSVAVEFAIIFVFCLYWHKSAFAKKKEIQELTEEVDRLRKERDSLKINVKTLEEELTLERRKTSMSVFAQEKGLIPCESPVCQICKHIVWYHGEIAGCAKGITCTDFEQSPPVLCW